ncbi:PREDICTED: tudor domain-containing protein 1 [Chrysochloris asiatica]|uniref:Tudor domain-containing protein 1 n=1 Tax=Chrysochloris asiatica TaxID=185453 RepID=A0A9B0WGJ4_CHRAS|nr:PREDICTED: tudor domain-containing protein 1 [Chrysochloris asiatica]
MAEPFNFEKNESKLALPSSLRSPGGHPNHPNFRLKSPESGNKINSFLLCEQTKSYLASQEDISVSSSPNGIIGEVVGSKGDRKTLLTGNPVLPLNAGNISPPKNINAKPNNNVPPAKSKKVHKLVENSLSINNPALFNSLGPPLRSTTCHRCGLFGSLRCSQCKQTYYCSIACQRRDWSSHSIVCKPVQQNFHKPEDNNSPFEINNMEVKNENDYPIGITKEITLCTEKIMFSDLRSLQLRKSMEIKGTITEFKHPSDFYVQLYSSEVLEYMNQLSTRLKETYANLLEEEDYIPVKGEVCVAKYTVDQSWNRVIIQDVDMVQKKAQVLYIDYGNEEVLPVNRIHQLNRNMDLFPPCAIKCFVANVVPAEGNWSNDCIQTIKPLLLDQYCSIKIVDILGEHVLAFAVDFKLPSSGKPFDHVLVDMGYGLQPKKQSADQNDSEDAGKMTAEDRIVVDSNDLIPKVLTLNVGEEFCGVVAHIQTPEDFFCQQLQSGHKLAELQTSLCEYCSRASPRFDFFPSIGDICCAQFSGVKPSLGIWTPEAICLMKKIVQNKMITVKVVDKLENSSLVELVDKSVMPSISVTKVLIEAGFAVGEKETVTTKASSLKVDCVPLSIESANPLEWTWVELAVDQTADVEVCVIYSPGEFYCHVLKEDALSKLNDLNKSLAEHCQQKLPNDFKAEMGQPCCAFFADIQPKKQYWTKEATARFQMCVTGIKLQARVVEITENGVGLELTDLSTSYPRIISDVLAGDDVVLTVSSPLKDLLPSNTPVNKYNLQVVALGPQDTSVAGQWKTIELAVNKVVQANILEIISPNLFYALPNEMPEDQEKLCMMTVELLEYCNAQRSPPAYSPRTGDACCAKYTSDDLWYRAIVLGTLDDAQVKVLYADYGNMETLPLCRIRPITASLLELPFQIIKCSLEGLMELNGSCSRLIIELLKNFMLNQNVMISIKGINKNVHTVSVEKCSENGPVNIADKLVHGLAKNITSKQQGTFNLEKMCKTDCCCTELQKQVEKHEQILLFLLNSSTSENKFIQMRKLLKS